MKCLIVLSALVAFSSAGLVAPFASPLAYSALPYSYGGLGLTSYGASPYLSSVLSAPITAYSAPALYASAPAAIAAPAVISAPAVASGVVKTQYHAQDELGQASYGHSEPLQTHNAVQDAFGNKVGSYSYVSPDGRVLRTDYVADALGFRVASNALPVGPGAGPLPVSDTPEVVAARAAHLAAHGRAKRDLVAVGHTPAATTPLATSIVAPQLAYAAHPLAYAASPLAYSASPLAYSASPLAYSASPLAYSGSPLAYAASPLAYSSPIAAPAILNREATLTTIVNNPGHAVSYRVD